MRGTSLFALAVAGANASPALDHVKRGFYGANNNALRNATSDTPTKTVTTTSEEPPASTTTTTSADVDTSEPDLPTASCGADGSSGCTSTSSFLQGIPTRVPPNCSGTSSYAGSVPPTVYSTVTETYTASPRNGLQDADEDAEDETLITPAPPCSSTVITAWFSLFDAYTSTVLVTKKTAVPFSEPTDPPSFTDPPDSKPGTTDSPDNGKDETEDVDCEGIFGIMCNIFPTDKPEGTPDGGCSSSDGDCDSNSVEASTSSGNAPSESATGSFSHESNPDELSDTTNDKTDDDDDDKGDDDGDNDKDDKDDDSINRTTVLSGVPIAVGSSTIQIGAQVITDIPTAPKETTIVANGQVFTINESEVVGPKITVPIPIAGSNSGPDSGSDSDPDSDPKPTITPVTAADLTFSIGPSEAIISGTTLTIGPDATPTTTVIDGKTISVGPDGLGFPTTTIEPPAAPTDTATGGAAAVFSTPSFLGSIAAIIPFLGAWGLI